MYRMNSIQRPESLTLEEADNTNGREALRPRGHAEQFHLRAGVRLLFVAEDGVTRWQRSGFCSSVGLILIRSDASGHRIRWLLSVYAIIYDPPNASSGRSRTAFSSVEASGYRRREYEPHAGHCDGGRAEARRSCALWKEHTGPLRASVHCADRSRQYCRSRPRAARHIRRRRLRRGRVGLFFWSGAHRSYFQKERGAHPSTVIIVQHEAHYESVVSGRRGERPDCSTFFYQFIFIPKFMFTIMQLGFIWLNEVILYFILIWNKREFTNMKISECRALCTYI